MWSQVADAAWHKDRLEGGYKRHQALPLWVERAGGAGRHPEWEHKIVKVLIYLQGHDRHGEDPNGGLMIVPRSHVSPSTEERRGARRIHTRKGSVIILEQRSTHREGNHAAAKHPDRIVISLSYGLVT